MKHEFDRIGRDMGYGACADEMWDEIERVYMGAEKVSKEALCYAYWTGNGYYTLKDAVDALEFVTADGEGRRALELVKRVLCRYANVEDELRKAISEIADGMNRLWEREGVKVRNAHLKQVEREERELEREKRRVERERVKAARAAEREEKRREREYRRQMREYANRGW